jgi:hypothetical protein
MKLRVVKTTDGKHIGLVVETPANEFGEMSKRQIADLSRGFIAGQFTPDSIVYLPPDRVRLVCSNYSILLEKIDG